MTRHALILTIISIFCFIALIVVFAFMRRFWRRQRFLRLDRFRAIYDPVVSAMVNYPGEISEKRLATRHGSLAWIAVEDALIEQLDVSEPRLYPRIYGFFEDLGYVDYYLKSLESAKMWKRARGAERLGIIKCSRAVDSLIKATADKTRDVRNMAVYSLGLIGDEKGLPAIMEALKIGIGSLEDISLRIVKSSILSFGRPAVKVVRRGLKDENWRVRAVVVDILGELEGPAVLEDLTIALFDSEPDVRAKAAKGLGKKRGFSAANQLMTLTEDPAWVVRMHSTRALGLIYAPHAINTIKLRLFDENWQVRRAAAEAMGIMKNYAMEPLRDILVNHADGYAKEMVVEELQRTGLVWSLVDGLEDGNEEIRQEAEDTLYAIGCNGAFSPLINALRRDSPVVRRRIIGILGRFKAERALDAVKATAESDGDAGVRNAARAVLGYP